MMVSHLKNQSKINQKNIIMKNSVLILSIALVSFSNISTAKSIIKSPSNLFQNIILSDDIATKEIDGTAKFKKPSLSEDLEVFNPETVIAKYPKTVKEIIADDDKIVEAAILDDREFMDYEESMKEIVAQSDLVIESYASNEIYPLYFERTVEEEIAELELIIESAESNEAYLLNFKKINSNFLPINTFNSKKNIGMN